MLNPEQIIEEAKKEETDLNLNLYELNFYLAIKKVLLLYSAKSIPKEVAQRYKDKAINEYIKQAEQYEFWKEIMQRHIDINKNTERARTELHKLLREENPDKDKMLKVCMKIICIDYNKEFEYWENKE